MKINWKKKLTSRKLWISVVSFISNIMVAAGVSENTVTQVAAIIMAGASVIAYIIAEGLADANCSVNTKNTNLEVENDDEK